MPQETLGDAIEQVARNVSLTNGQGMTPYSDDTVIGYLISAHELIKAAREWEEMVVWRQRTLDGVYGKTTELITDTKDWKKIRRIYHESMQTPMPLISSYANPLTSTLMFGYRGLAPQDDVTGNDGRYLVQFYPATLTGQVLFQLEYAVDFTNKDTVLPIDWWWHVYAASWQWATSDGGNEQQAKMYQGLMTLRASQVSVKENSRPSWEQPNQMTPNDWWEQDAPYA